AMSLVRLRSAARAAEVAVFCLGIGSESMP
ncbi:MAG: hypothetical protein QOI59_718, partial [Gammaproteobacteria bacterium]|nr:hypothetical protein [Gammaproteobacteria bacterium]